MRIFIAGATGAIGRPLLPILRDAGHEVVALTRSAGKADSLRAAGATAIVGDVFDLPAVEQAVSDARPDVVIQQLTDLPHTIKLRGFRESYARNNQVRRDGTRNLVSAARRARVKRFISQSVAFLYAPEGGTIKTENDPLYHHAPDPLRESVVGLQDSERAALDTPHLDGIVLRYGFFYGPGTWIARRGAMGEMVAAGKYPIVGSGDGVYSFIHVTDAALATAAFVERGGPGIYNIADDDPAPVREWLPVFAAAVGGPKPRHVPEFVASLLIGRGVVSWQSTLRGVTNAKAKREVGWQPKYASWRQGFAEALDSQPHAVQG